jgi:hypothetical protein
MEGQAVLPRGDLVQRRAELRGAGGTADAGDAPAQRRVSPPDPLRFKEVRHQTAARIGGCAGPFRCAIWIKLPQVSSKTAVFPDESRIRRGFHVRVSEHLGKLEPVAARRDHQRSERVSKIVELNRAMSPCWLGFAFVRRT